MARHDFGAAPAGGVVRLLHLSDTHLTGDESTRHYGVVDTRAALARVLAHAASVVGIDAVVVSGDLSDDGTPESYRHLRATVDAWAQARGARAVYVMGNHDKRAGFEEVLGERTGTVAVAGLRIIRLDSSVPGRGYGEIDDDQLDLVRRAAAGDGPAIVLLHHPPTAAPTPLLAGLALERPAELIEICRSAGVLAVLAGHYHHSLVTAEGGVPVLVAPGITNTTDVLAPAGHERAHVGSGYAVIDVPLTADAAPRVTVCAVPGPGDGTELFDLSDDQVAAIIAQAGPPSGSAPGH